MLTAIFCARLKKSEGNCEEADEAIANWHVGCGECPGACYYSERTGPETGAARPAETVRKERSDDPHARWREAAYRDLHAARRTGTASHARGTVALWYFRWSPGLQRPFVLSPGPLRRWVHFCVS